MLRALEKMKGAALAVSSPPPRSEDCPAITEGGNNREIGGKSNFGFVKLGGIAETGIRLEAVEDLSLGSSEFLVSESAPIPKNGSFRLVSFHPAKICGARVGAGSFVCLKARDSCTVKAHKAGRNLLDLPLVQHFGICKVTESNKEPLAVLSDCFVQAELVSLEILAEWDHSTMTAVDWSFRFQAVRSTGDQKLLTPEKIMAKQVEMLEATHLILEDEEELEISDSWGADVPWNFSPTQTQHHLNVEFERELFESGKEEVKFSTLFDQSALLSQVVDSVSSALMDFAIHPRKGC